MAATPGAQPFTVINGGSAVTWTGGGTVGTVNAGTVNNAIVSWNPTAFNILAGDTFQFLVPAGGAILNKVGYGTSGNSLGSPDNATINGQISSTGKVFVLVNGSISVGADSKFNAVGGTVLSTLAETDNFTFQTSGNLLFNGAPQGTVAIGGTGAAVTTSGNLSIYGGGVALNNLQVTGDLIVNSRNTAGVTLTGADGLTTVSGNLTVATSGGGITQGANALQMNGLSTAVASLSTNAGAAVSLPVVGNDFKTVTANATSLTLNDANSIALGASTLSGSLSVTAVNEISTSGAVLTSGNVDLNSTASGNITYANNSTVGGVFSATTAGSIVVNTVGSLTLGNIGGGLGGGFTLGSIAVTSGGTGYTTAPTVSITGGGGTGATATATVVGGAVTQVTITSVGTGYTSLPVISFTGGGARPTTSATATAVISAILNNITIPGSSGGAGYTAAPTVTISGGGGTGATADAIVSSGVVTGFTITNNGTGYTSAPTITFAGGAPVTPANATAAVLTLANGTVAAVNVTGAGGAGYTAAPTVTISGGGGTGATATAAITGSVVSSVTPTPGTGFTSAPSVTFAGGGTLPTTAATAPAVPAVGVVGAATSVTATSAATVTVGGAILAGNTTIQGAQVSANATGSIGSTVTPGTLVTINATAGSAVLPGIVSNTANVTATGGSISQFTGTTLSTNATTGSTWAFNAGTGGSITLTNPNTLNGTIVQLTGSTASINNTRDLTIGATTLTGNLSVNTTGSAVGAGNVTLGAGFGSAAQDININGSLNINTNNASIVEDPATISNVFGSLNLNTAPSGIVTSLVGANITNGGSYTATPTVTISGGGGSGAAATAVLTGGVVTGITITNAGSGYTSAPTITFSAAGAVATANTGGSVSFTAATAGVTGGGRYGQFNVTSADINLNENTTLNLGTINGRTVATRSTAGDILINGTLNAAGTFTANANSASISEGASGVMIIGNTASFNSSNSFGTNLSSTGNSFGGAVTFRNGLTNIIVASSNITIGSGTCVTGGNSTLTVNSSGGSVRTDGEVSRLIAVSSGNIIVAGGNHGSNLTLTANDASATSITQSGAVRSNGTMTISSQGNVTLNNISNNITGPVVLNNVVRDSAISSSRDLTISGTSAGNLTAVAGASTGSSFANPWNVILGNLNVAGLTAAAYNANTPVNTLGPISVTSGGSGYTAAPTVAITGAGVNAAATAVVVGGVVTAVNVTNAGATTVGVTPTITFGSGFGETAGATAVPIGGNATSGTSGNITQLANSSVHVENTVDLITFNGNVLLGNNGNSFGRVQASTGGFSGFAGTGNITVVEDSTMKVGTIATTARAELRSRFASIIEDPVTNVVVSASDIVLNAPSGSVQLGGLNRTSGTTTGNIQGANITAAGTAQIATTGNISLGATAANSLSVSANNITQGATPLNIFGLSSFNATNSITLTNVDNNFGPISLTSAALNQNLAVSEGNTLNIRTVSMPGGGNGTVSLTSVNGDIIDTGLGGARLGGNSTAAGTGVVTLSAINGNILLDDPTSDIATTSGLVFNGKNVTISVLGGTGSNLVLGASTAPSAAAGNLTVSSALGNIANAGSLTASGAAYFQTGTGNISITVPTGGNIGFGTLRFQGNQVSIQESGNMDILTGSTAFGPANLLSGGSIAIIDVGGGPVTFGNTVNMSAASGSITLKLLQAVGQLAVTASGTKDLSALSLSTDLNSKTPIYGGAGANIDPKP